MAKNKLFINKKVWGKFSNDEMSKYLVDVYDYYRSTGLPYFDTSMEWREKEFAKLKRYDYKKCILENCKEIKQTMHGLSLCWSYHPHHYEVQCNSMRTVFDTFHDDDLLRKVIAKRVKFGDNMSDNGLRKMLKIYSGTQCVSNFRPTASASIYERFCPDGGKVFDMSAGFGGRMLGAHIAGVEYYGVDPSVKTMDGLVAMNKDFGLGAKLKCTGSENKIPTNDKFNLCFTSPPYFDCEKYAEDATQSYVKFPTHELWMNGFLKTTLLNCIDMLEADGTIVLNVQNVPSYKTLVNDTIGMCKSIGLVLVDTWGLQLSRLAKGGIKTEPILIFKMC